MKRGQRGSRSIATSVRDRLVHFGRADRAVVDRAQLVRPRLRDSRAGRSRRATARDCDSPRARPRPRRSRRGGSILPSRRSSSRQDRALRRELILVRRVLVVAAAAAREIRARRRDALRRRLEHFERPRAHQPGLLLLATPARIRSPGRTNGANTTRPSRRASPSPPYTNFSTVTSKLLTIKNYSRPLP